jgi:UDP-glucuronate decarboxylase
MRNGKVKQVLVAGGAGFLGSHLCDVLLARGDRVFCVDNLQTGSLSNLAHLEREASFTFLEADVIEPLPEHSLPKHFDRVFNLACAASPDRYQADPEHTMLTSVLGTRNLLRLSEQCGARFLLASTSEVYGDPEVHPQVETYWGNVNSTGPRACYDEGKRAAEALSFDFHRGRRADIRVARIFNTYGPRMHADDGRVVSNVVSQALHGADITIYGDGNQTRSFCYVDDLVEGMIRLMSYEGEQPGPVNLGNPVELTVGDLVQRVIALTGSPSRVVHRPLPTDDPRRRKPDASRAMHLLGWSAKTSLEAGLPTTVQWFRDLMQQETTSTVRRVEGALAN